MTRTQSLWQRIERRARRSVVRLQGQQVLTILGMHRSGTSSLAGSLEQAGLYLGGRDVAGRGQWNAKGNRESKVLMRLHEDVLNANSGAWDRPPAHIVWSTEHKRRRDQFIRSRATQRYWGFKDPRSILLIEGWLEAIPEMGMVATIRDPVAVAQSLKRRAGKRRAGNNTLDVWLRLWLEYNERLLELQQAHGFPVIDFDLPADGYQQRLGQLIEQLGLRATPSGEHFFESSLRSSERVDVELPAAVADVYARLTAVAAAQASDVVNP